MSAPKPPPDPNAPPAPKGGKKKLALLAVPVLLVGVAAALWFSGIGQKLLSHNKPAISAQPSATVAATPVFADLPDIVANLSSPPHHQSFIKLKAKVELASAADLPPFTASMPRILDLLQTYLRDMRPEELRGSAGTYRLREELIARANIAAAPARVTDLLFVELLVQ
jgi:flagellar FliL protein